MDETLPPSTQYGLRNAVLSPMETLAQSVSTMAPTTTPVATIPLVCALAGNGTWLAYVLATAAVLLVALCIARYARYSASPGSLYTYVSMTLPRWLSALAAWSLLLAYVATGSSVIGGFYHYANLLLRDATGHGTSAALLAIFVTAISMAIAWRDVKISARLMLWIEAVSVTLILILVTLVLWRHGLHWDWNQLHLSRMTGSGLRLGLVLALFSFVGFESATTLGSEARNPLHTIPRAVIQSAILSGAIFTICAYAEVLGFRRVGQDLGASQAPMRVLAGVGRRAHPRPADRYRRAGKPVRRHFGLHYCRRASLALDVAPRLGARLAQGHARQTRDPRPRDLVTGMAAVAPVAVLAVRGASGLDVYGWLGSLATYGFIVTYALVSFALPKYLRERGASSIGAHAVAWLACAAMLFALVGNLYPVPEGPYGNCPTSILDIWLPD